MRAMICAAALFAVLAGCKSGGEHLSSLDSQSDQSLTAGQVQKNIKLGMSGAEVAAVLGSPNIVTTDEERRESWIYDKVATEQVYSNSEGGLFLLIAGVSGSSGASKQTQRTLTIIIKFDDKGLVRDYSYHQSKF